MKNCRCPNCNYRQEARAELTPVNGSYDRGLVLAAAAIHTYSLFLKHTRGLLTSIFGVTPETNAIHNWKIKVGILVYQLNREALDLVKVKEILIDELLILPCLLPPLINQPMELFSMLVCLMALKPVVSL